MSFQPDYFPPTYTPPPAPASKPYRGLAIAALCVGIPGVIFGMIPLTFIIAFICGALALIFGLIGRRWAIGKWGVALGVVAIGLGIVGAVIVNRAVDDVGQNLDHLSTCMNGSSIGTDGNMTYPPGCEDMS
jgi:hypothetical protein